MKAKEFRKVILFMANRWNKKTAIEIFGAIMGLHFWGKWLDAYETGGSVHYKGPDYATMRLFYEFDDYYLQILLDYIDEDYNR